MNTDQIVTSGSISTKIIIFFVLMGLEIICNSITFFYNPGNKSNLYQQGSLNNPNMDLQMFITFGMMG